jgi:hypothetical protein
MRDPDRLVDGGEDLEVALLRSALPDAPSQGSKRRMLVALGIASSVATASAEATAAGTLAKVGLAGLLKWVGIGVIGAAAMVGVVETVAPQAAPVSRVEIVAPPPLPRTVSEQAPPTVKEQAPAPPAASEEVVSPETSPQAARSQEPASTTSLADEVRALDGARKALAGGNARECLAKLESYRAEFPQGVLGLEATVLRIEALAASGARTQARDLGTRFLESHPDSAHAARVRSVIGAETIP